MVYLTDEDFTPIIRDAFLTELIDDNPGILSTAEMQAMSLIENYLHELYDMPVIWAQTGTDRNGHLVRMLVSIIRYDLYQRLPKGGFGTPADVSADKTDAMDWLKLVCAGKLSANLARKIVNGVASTRTRFGSDVRQNWSLNNSATNSTLPS
jgi:hypothetical protein